MRLFFRLSFWAWLLWRLFSREGGPRSEGIQTRPDGPSGRTVLVGRHEFFVRETGPVDAPPLVLLHGWLYDSHATFHRIVPALAERHRVYLIDLRNHGRSDRIRSRFDIEDLADEVVRVLDALDLGVVPIVGYSMGGMTAQAIAVRHPGRVSSLVLGATAARPIDRPVWLSASALTVGRAFSRVDRTFLPRIAHRYLMRHGVFPDEHGAWLWQVLLDRDPDLYYEAGFAINRFDARDRLRAIDVPTLVIIPTEDQLIPASQQYETAAGIDDVVVVELVGARHEAVLTHADDMAKAILGHV